MALNIALVGCGRFGRGYVPAVAQVPDAQLVAVCDPVSENAHLAAGASGAASYSRWEQVVSAGGIDAVIVATPNYLHAPISLAAAAKGLHVLCEKPLATTITAAHEVVRACAERGVVLGVDLSSRYSPAFRAAHSMVRSGRLGEVQLVTNVYHYTLGPALPGRTWHSDAEQMGGGALIQMGIHSLDRVCWFADASLETVYAQVRAATARWADNLALVTLGFVGGVLGQVEVAGVSSAPRNRLTVHLSGGQIEVEGQRLAWHAADAAAGERPDGASPAATWHEEQHVGQPLVLAVQDWVSAIREGRAPECSGLVALPAHEACFAAYRSASEDRAVRLDATCS